MTRLTCARETACLVRSMISASERLLGIKASGNSVACGKNGTVDGLKRWERDRIRSVRTASLEVGESHSEKPDRVAVRYS